MQVKAYTELNQRFKLPFRAKPAIARCGLRPDAPLRESL